MNTSRYQRQLLIEGWSDSTQKSLQKKTVFVAGAGGLGAPVINYLAAAGIGHLRICDGDKVEISNLNRQVLYSETDINAPKAETARLRTSKLNSEIQIEAFVDRIDAGNVEALIGNVDIIVDCLDNYKSRLVLNRYAARTDTPLVHAGVQAMHGQLTLIHTPETPCLRCLLPEEIQELSPKPIVGAAAGVMGSLAALEAIKFLTGLGDTLMNQLLVWDGTDMSFEVVALHRKDDCPVCG